jgi:hypothetical protein
VVQSVEAVVDMSASLLPMINALPPYLDDIVSILQETLRAFELKCTTMVCLSLLTLYLSLCSHTGSAVQAGDGRPGVHESH